MQWDGSYDQLIVAFIAFHAPMDSGEKSPSWAILSNRSASHVSYLRRKLNKFYSYLSVALMHLKRSCIQYTLLSCFESQICLTTSPTLKFTWLFTSTQCVSAFGIHGLEVYTFISPWTGLLAWLTVDTTMQPKKGRPHSRLWRRWAELTLGLILPRRIELKCTFVGIINRLVCLLLVKNNCVASMP